MVHVRSAKGSETMSGRYGRSATVIRTLSLLRVLQTGHGLTLYELAQRFGVTVRTIRRDLAVLESVGYRCEGARGWEFGDARGRWRLGRVDRRVVA